jgi:hypothetical protein
VEGLTEEPERLIRVFLPVRLPELAAEMDALLQRAADKRLRGVPLAALCCGLAFYIYGRLRLSTTSEERVSRMKR